ncbi:MAG: DUF4258 domain-containing protein [Chloroflexi bacterium]|nr:DUF4258 domain-containing protein [Chloroflexota bacterium]
MTERAHPTGEVEIEISPHARQQMAERGAEESEVPAAVRSGLTEAARRGRILHRKNFRFEQHWRGRLYRIKQVAAVVASEGERLVVVTVYVFYF